MTTVDAGCDIDWAATLPVMSFPIKPKSRNLTTNGWKVTQKEKPIKICDKEKFLNRHKYLLRKYHFNLKFYSNQKSLKFTNKKCTKKAKFWICVKLLVCWAKTFRWSASTPLGTKSTSELSGETDSLQFVQTR